MRENVRQIEDYLQAADIGLFTSRIRRLLFKHSLGDVFRLPKHRVAGGRYSRSC